MTSTPYDLEVIYGPDESEKCINHPLKNLLIKLQLWIFGSLWLLGPSVFIFCCLTPVSWPIAIPYLLWIYYYDRETPEKGGRKISYFKKLKVWTTFRDYFSAKMIKTAELPPNKNYLLAAFPHGIFCYGLCCSVWTDGNNFSKAYPGLSLYSVVLDKCFSIPLWRDIILFMGGVSSSAKSIEYVLNGPPGSSCVIVVGGVAEALRTNTGVNSIVLQNRKGFVKLALKTGASLVPIYSFGENDTFHQPSFQLYTSLQHKMWSALRIPMIILKGRGFFQEVFGLLPFQRPITTVVGKPIHLPKVEQPNQELIDKYHQKFIEELTKLFDSFKGRYDAKGDKAQLIID